MMEGENVRSWTPQVESMPREKLEEMQTQLLRSQLNYVYDRAPFYHKHFEKSGVKPSNVKSLNDLRKIPLTKASDLQSEMGETGDPYSGRRCVPEGEILTVYGPNQHPMPENPLLTGITDCDRNVIIQHLARNLVMSGIHSGETIQSLCWAWELFNRLYINAHLYLSPSLCEIMGIVPVTLEIISLEAQRTFATASLLKPSTIIADLGHLAQLAAVAEQNGVKAEEMGCKRIILKEQRILTDKEKETVRGQWKADVYTMLAVQDNMLYAADCDRHNGLHVWEDAFIVEVVDEETGEPLEDGEEGKLAVTNLFAKACPMIRYLTGVTARIDIRFSTEDFIELTEETCERGTTHPLRAYPRERT